ncbi:mechanosensitive ion channel family protein [Colwellia psychrerythraea]|uniref:Small-conductance mechanosensitive channel n=1 Tax=Colwellia psychrerythraea TaxID=28229 RepID=A0A099KP18_COLPS|nr:mechanosensitive ion channel domain-containing protein [Colwellia psychrerythraea]KGJ91627.1 MscS Mechanosensitive ion channel [Colwellia psychrerythraea]
MEINIEKIEHYVQMLGEMGLQFGVQFLLAVVVYLAGNFIIKRVLGLVELALKKKEVEATLHSFLLSILGTLLKAIQIIVFASMIGIQTASLIAVLGAAGLAIGLALQGSLANFAGGVLILLFRPFKNGDAIKAQGYVGTVEEIQIFNTILKTFDNQRIIIPNGLLSNGCVTNININGTRRVDMVFGIGYDDDITKAKTLLRTMLEADERVLKDKAIDIWVGEHGESSINLFVRPWTTAEDYWAVYFDMMEKVKVEFDKAGISIPYPQRDVHVHQTQIG